MFTELARARMRSIDRGKQEQEQARQAEEAQIRQAALLASLEGSGIVDQSAADPTAEPGRYKPLGNTGRVLDTTQTAAARERAARLVQERQAAAEIARQIAAAKARYPELAGQPDDVVQGMLEGKMMPDAPKPEQPRYDPERGGYVSPQGFTPVPGLPPKPVSGGGDDGTSWQIKDTPDGMVQINPKTNEVRPVMMNGQPVQGIGSPTQQSEQNALGDIEKALDQFESELNRTGARVIPSVEKSTLKTAYVNVQMQAKELYKLGVLTGPDMDLITGVLNDPTSLRYLAEAGGSSKELTKRVLAQIGVARKIVADKKANRMRNGRSIPTGGATPPSQGKKRTAAEILAAHKIK